MIAKDDMFAPMLTACPSFETRWREFMQESARHPEQEPLYYLALSDLSVHLVEQFRARRTAEFPNVFQVVERWHVEGDSYVREAATVGLLEDLQNDAYRLGMDPVEFERWLGS